MSTLGTGPLDGALQLFRVELDGFVAEFPRNFKSNQEVVIFHQKHQKVRERLQKVAKELGVDFPAEVVLSQQRLAEKRQHQA